MAFNNYLEDENDKPYFTTNSLAYYYDKMEGFAEKVEGSAKALNLTKEEVEKRLTLYIEQNKNELDQRLAQWDGKLETFDSSVETLLSEWVNDGTLINIIDTTLIDKKIAPVTAQLADTSPLLNNGKINLPDDFPALPFNVFKRKSGEFYSNATPYNQFDWSDAIHIYIKTLGTGTDGKSADLPIPLHNFKTNFGNGVYGTGKKFVLNFVDYIYYLTATGSGSIVLDLDADILIRSISPSKFTWLGRLKHSGVNGYASAWTADSGVFKSVQLTTHTVIDVVNLTVFEDYGMPSVYVKVDSLAACQSQKGTFFGTGADVFVNPHDEHNPNDLIMTVGSPVITFNQPNARTTMYENIGFLPSTYRDGIGGNLNTTVYTFGCKFHRAISNGFFMTGLYKVFSFNTVVSHPTLDAFNYHTSSVNSLAVEVNCIGYGAGKHKMSTDNDTNSNNGSTSHGGIYVARFGSRYYECEGNIVVDIDDCYSINIGVDASEILDTMTGSNTGAFRFSGTSKPKYVIESSGYGKNVGYGVQGSESTYVVNFTGNANLQGAIKGRGELTW